MPRAAASKAWNYLPQLIAPAEFVKAITDAAAAAPVDPGSPFGRAVSALPQPPRPGPRRWFAGTYDQALRRTIRRCLDLGLFADDIAWHLGTDVDTIRLRIKQLAGRPLIASDTQKRLFRGTVVVAAAFVAFKAIGFTWSVGSRRIGASGQVLLAGRPLDTGVIEFRSFDSTTAVVTGPVIKRGSYRIHPRSGLLPGSYVVMISSPEPAATPASNSADTIAPPAAERIPENFNIASSQRVEVRRFCRNVFDFSIPEIRRDPGRKKKSQP